MRITVNEASPDLDNGSSSHIRRIQGYSVALDVGAHHGVDLGCVHAGVDVSMLHAGTW